MPRRTETLQRLQRLAGSSRHRKLWLSVVVVRALVLAPSALADEPAPPAERRAQKLTLDEVRIEGKLYSPQALFIVTRTTERFARDSVVPHYLRRAPEARLLPVRLDDDALAAQRDAVMADSSLPSTTSPPPRRSP